MESNGVTERKAFDETKTGVKGLMDSGITEIPDMFRVPQAILKTLKPSLHKLKVPTIDLEGGSVHYKNGEDMIIRKSLVEQIGEAAETWGVFQVINHGIPIDVLERMLEGTRGFHELDTEVKKEFHSRDHNRNFFYYSNIDLFSSAAAMWRDSLCCYTAPNPPPSEDLPAVVREIVMEYSKEMMKLGELIFELLSEALGLNPNHLKHMDCTKFQVMSGHYYPHCPQPDLAIGLTKHKDLSFFTILLQDNIPGLQVLHDQDWIEVPPVPGALVINIGDLLQLITNDKFMSVEHMVMANGASQARVSVPYFFTSFMRENPSIYGPIRELLSEQNPPKYRDCSINELKNMAGSKTFSIPRLKYFKI